VKSVVFIGPNSRRPPIDGPFSAGRDLTTRALHAERFHTTPPHRPQAADVAILNRWRRRFASRRFGAFDSRVASRIEPFCVLCRGLAHQNYHVNAHRPRRAFERRQRSGHRRRWRLPRPAQTRTLVRRCIDFLARSSIGSASPQGLPNALTLDPRKARV